MDKSLELTKMRKQTVLGRINDAVSTIQKMMQDPGKLAQQDQEIGIAILGKLRVAKALVNGDLAPITKHQHKVDWVVKLREGVQKALAHPSKENLENAQALYKAAAAANKKRQSRRARALKAKEKNEKRQRVLAAQKKKSKIRSRKQKQQRAKQRAKIEAAKKQQIANEKANSGNTHAAPVEAAPVEVEAPPAIPKPPAIVKHIARGFFDPDEEP